ncbi:MAG: stalk domain-containing protein [Pseudomonadota bacterium]
MKKFKKMAAVILTICIIAGLLSGCTGTTEGKALYDALMKTQTVKASQNDMEFTLKLDASGLSPEDQQSFAQAKAMLDGAAFSMNMKQVANADNTAAKAEMNMDMLFGGMSMNMGVWVDMDLNSSNPKFVEIIKLPAMLTAMDPSMAGKEYMVMDLGKAMSTSELGNVDYTAMMKLTKDLQDKSNVFLKSYLAQYDPGFKFITDAGTKSIVTPEGTVKAHVYQIKLDDKTAKKLVRYTVENFANSKEAMEFLVDYFKLIQKLTESTTPSTASTEELEKIMSDFEAEKPVMLAEFNSFMDKLENVQIIGSDGLVFEYAIDENDYIVSQSGSLNFLIDTAKLAALEDGLSSAGSGTFDVTFGYNMLTYNINKNLTISMPAVTPANSLDYNEMMKSQNPSTTKKPEPAQVLNATPTSGKVLVNGKTVSFDAYTINGNNYFKLRDLAKAVNGTEKQFDVTWDGTKKTINLVSGKAYTAVGGEMTPGDGKAKTPVVNTSAILKDGTIAPLGAYTINGNNYFKLRDIAQAFNIGVTWDPASKTIGIDTTIDYVAP